MVHPQSIDREILLALSERLEGLPLPPPPLQRSVDHLVRLGLVETDKGDDEAEWLRITAAGHEVLAVSQVQQDDGRAA
jgi:DNA-binding IclR family transcriptional regulator